MCLPAIVCLLAPAPEAGAIAYRQAPMLEEAVRRGELPPLPERLPPEPMVVTPAREIGRYGGTWHRMMRGSSDFHAYSRCVYEQMVRWRTTEGGGLEVGPGLVQRWEFADGDRTLRLHLRRGLRWSDGHPFSAGDVLFWWQKIAGDPNLSGTVPRYWTPDDEPMELARIDSFTVELRFARPYPLAVKYLAFKGNQWPLVFERAGFYAPRHYLEPWLPAEGAEDLAGYSLFEQKANDFNPERPVMSAWRVIEWEPGSHLLAERNPYYWKVDPAGNQLPYLDRIRMEIFLNREMINFRAVTGALQMQLRHFNREDLPLLRSFTEERGYRIIEYDAPGIRGIMPNLEYPGDPVVRGLLKNRHLRIALSLAIDRELINRLCYGGSGRITPMALHPSAPDYVEVPEAPDHTRYDPERARALLDSIGLDRRDADGFRLGPDGERVSLILELMVVEGPDMDAVEIVRSQWEEVGIQTALKPEERTLYHQRVTQNGEHMIGIVGAEATFPLLSSPRWFATSLWAEWAHHWARWYLSEGRRGAEPPPEVAPAGDPGHPVGHRGPRRAAAAVARGDPQPRREHVGHPAGDPGIADRRAQRRLRQRPRARHLLLGHHDPGLPQPRDLLQPRRRRRAPRADHGDLHPAAAAAPGADPVRDLRPDLRRHPAAPGRLLRLPAGAAGRERVPRRPAGLRRPAPAVPPRRTLVEAIPLLDRRLPAGGLRLLLRVAPAVADLIGERLGLTFVMSLGSLLFMWAVAIPIGIYSARHRLSAGDYGLTFVAFIGLCVPNFVIALVAMYASVFWFGGSAGGLFSPEYKYASWSAGRVLDLLRHLWIPVVVIGAAGTATMMRLMRTSMLDVLGRPYITTARAKGLAERWVIYKYAVRVAINPMISIMGLQIPQLVSGSIIVSIVLGLPTTGPLFYRALETQDKYLAGTFLMLLAVLLLLGNLVADILLALVDPRIRLE